ncbi:MAG: prepilin-type N-terminal cleavage/methylation domain-containing protein [Phycisphaerae bacterium]|nr:prepilin-type N-terminal cleavage/methylation domain-containing protein [Phycisphaerae bacterium]
MRKHGFTLIELLVICAILGLLISILLPALSAASNFALQAKCGSQLHNLAVAFRNYAFDNDQSLPRLRLPSPNTTNRWGWIGYKYATALDSTTLEQYQGNSRALYTCLVRGGYAEPDRFICPAMNGAAAVPDSVRSTIWAFPSASCISYSFQNTWGASVRLSSDEGCPIMADRNPQFVMYKETDGDCARIRMLGWPTNAFAYAQPGENKACSALNHGGRGQNVLCVGGNVKWTNTPLAGRAIVGTDGATRVDNIYTRYDGTKWGANPADAGDTMWTQGAGADLDSWLVP